jgi:hypothetical protein
MKFIGHVLAFMLASALSLAVSSLIFEQTLWNATYLQRQATDTKLYASLSEELPKAFAAADPELAKAGLPPLDPVFIETQLGTLLPQLIDHVHRGGPAPTVDMAALYQALGLPVPDDAGVQIVDLGPADKNIIAISQNLRTAGQFSPLAIIVFALLIIVVMRHHRFPTLARAGLETAVAMGLIAGVLWLAPNFLVQSMSSPTLAPARDAIGPFLEAVCHGIAVWFGIAALVFIGLAVALWFTHHALALKARFKSKPKATTPTPNAGNNRFPA